MIIIVRGRETGVVLEVKWRKVGMGWVGHEGGGVAGCISRYSKNKKPNNSLFFPVN
jgi:hypothetical protein